MAKLHVTSLQSALASKGAARAHEWIDTGTLNSLFSIEVRLAPRRWGHVVDAGKVLFFDSRESAASQWQQLSGRALEQGGSNG